MLLIILMFVQLYKKLGSLVIGGDISPTGFLPPVD